MKKMITMSLVAAATTAAFASTSGDIADLQAQIDKLKVKQGKINAQSANDNIKWGVDFRTAYDNLNYDLADGSSRSNDSLLSMRLWLNMAYAADEHNIFKGQLSMNKAFGADFSQMENRTFSMGGMFDWTGNEALTDNTLKVRQAFWLYLGDEAFGADIPWTFSIGRRPSTNGFLANLSQDDAAQSPLGHVINVEFDGLSSKLDLSNVTGVPGMSFKVCLGYGSTNAAPLFGRLDATAYADDVQDGLDDIKLGGFIFEPYNDGQYIVKATWYRAYDLPGFDSENFLAAFAAGDMGAGQFSQNGNMDGAALSVLIDGVTEDGYFADVKLFGSFAWSKTNPDDGAQMLGVSVPNAAYGMPGQPEYLSMGADVGESQSGTSYWFGAYLPITDGENNFGTVGLEYNHGSEYWRPFTYAEDTMIGSKIAARGDAWEANYTYQINDALSFQARYVSIDYDYTGSNSFFGSDGTPVAIDDIQAGAAGFDQTFEAATKAGMISDPTDPNAVFMGMVGALMQDPNVDQATAINQVQGMSMMKGFSNTVVDKAQDFRMYLRYRF